MSADHILWQQLVSGQRPMPLLVRSLWSAAFGLSELVGEQISIGEICASQLALGELGRRAKAPERPCAGVFLRAEGDLPGQALLLLRHDDARELLGLMLGGAAAGPEFGACERSALAECGNAALASMLNTVASVVGGILRPSPPGVMIGSLGGIIAALADAAGGPDASRTLIESRYSASRRQIRARLWIIPGLAS
ncbi:MAG TPA: hypothetical protein VGE07_16515 [Herpetosiphonaceae bacterium]